MSREYANVCKAYNCKAKIFQKTNGSIDGFGTPELLILFTGTVSHKMVRCALSKADGKNIKIARSHSSSIAALKNIMQEHFGRVV